MLGYNGYVLSLTSLFMLLILDIEREQKFCFGRDSQDNSISVSEQKYIVN